MNAHDDNVIELRPRDEYDGFTCSCGSAWFRTAVCLSGSFSVTGYAAPLVCIECGTEW